MKGKPTAFDLRLNAFVTRVFYRRAHRIARFPVRGPGNRIRSLTDLRTGSAIECEPGWDLCPWHIDDKVAEVKRMSLGGR
jgi:hypothetical protein